MPATLARARAPTHADACSAAFAQVSPSVPPSLPLSRSLWEKRDARQVLEAVAHGADTALLMVSILSQSRLRALIACCRTWGMEPLVEAASPSRSLGATPRSGVLARWAGGIWIDPGSTAGRLQIEPGPTPDRIYRPWADPGPALDGARVRL